MVLKKVVKTVLVKENTSLKIAEKKKKSKSQRSLRIMRNVRRFGIF